MQNSVLKRILFIFAVLFFSTTQVFAVFSTTGIPDSSDIRKNLVETWFEAPIDLLRDNQPEKIMANDGNLFEVRLEESSTNFVIVVAPRTVVDVEINDNKGNRIIKEDFYDAIAPGGWILLRNRFSGKPVALRYYFSIDNDIYVELVPDETNRSLTYANFFVYDVYAARNVPIRLPFSRFYTISLSSLVNLTSKTLPWNYAEIHTGIYHSVLQMIGMIQYRLQDLEYVEDLMLDEREKQVYISTGERYFSPDPFDEHERGTNSNSNLNAYDEEEKKILLSSGGFVKWICDGLVMPIAGGGLLRSPLIVPTVPNKNTSYHGILSQKYNLSFALDWTRHLASAVRAVDSGSELRYPDSGVDVTIEPFSAQSTPKGVSRVAGYERNIGYSVKQLRALLYVLAVTDPGRWFLGALRQTDRNVTPEVHIFNQCMAFFPYFDDSGKFRCKVFANCEEIDLDNFVEIFQNDFIHLTRINSSDFFFPTRLEDLN